MAKMTIQIEIEVQDKPFVSDTEISLWMNRRMDDQSPNPKIEFKSWKFVGPRR